MAPVAVGLGLGVALSRVAVRLLESQLFGVAPTDPATFGAAALTITAVALAACALPARRAARIDPAESLRGRGL